MSTPTSETPRPLTRLVDLFGARPDPNRSDGWYWYMLVLGALLLAVNVLPGAGWNFSSGDPYTQLLALSVGLNMASWGASGLLLRRGREALAVGLSVLQALNFFPMTAFLFLAVWGRFGLPWAVGLALAACTFYAVVRRRSRRHERANGTGARGGHPRGRRRTSGGC